MDLQDCFHLGHAGFVAVGAYTTALLTMSEKVKNQNFFMEPLMAPFNHISVPFIVALLIAGLLSAL
nr:hypothetical protein [Clostridium beijerinckii]